MTMLSFRVDAGEAARTVEWAERLGVDRSELLRDALRRHLNRLASEAEAATLPAPRHPDADDPLAAIADWGPAEDWADWADAPG